MTALGKVSRGLILVGVVALISILLADNVLPNIGSVTLAIMIGMLIGNLPFIDREYAAGFNFAEKKLLPMAIVCLGAELQLRVLAGLGVPTMLIIVTIVGSTIFLSLVIGRRLGFPESFSLLMGTGNAICGSSAIAAISPLVDGKEEDVGLSVGVVNLLGTVGIFFLPVLVQLSRLDVVKGGVVIGGSLQAVGQVVAAGYTVNADTGNMALLVKMGRVLLLGPIALLVSWRTAAGTKIKAREAIKVPNFIIGFLLVSILVSWQIVPETTVTGIKLAGKWLLLLAMAGIGLKLHLPTMLKQGPRTLMFGILIATMQLLILLMMVSALY